MRVASAQERAIVGDEQQRAGELAQVVLEPAGSRRCRGGWSARRAAADRAARPAPCRAACAAASRPTARRANDPPAAPSRDTTSRPAARAASRRAPRAGAAARRAARAAASSVFGDVDRRVVVRATRSPSEPRPAATSSNTVRSGGAGNVLVEPRDAQAGRAPDRPAVGRDLARDDLQQARLARAVAADETHALAGSIRRSEFSKVADGRRTAKRRKV